ncbi:MAG: conserved membrane protein of unknown function [Candidatus Thorarchaeota archaeon]|nr:MAG: conserved membrane protein of unknown function [Candidatus Thorarchaeota archaeon]
MDITIKSYLRFCEEVQKKMFRTIIALLVCLVTAIVIGIFQILALDVTTIGNIVQDPNVVDLAKYQGALLFGELIFPYTFALNGVYAPIAALGVAGFIAGLLSKSGVRMLFVSIIALALFFVGYAALTVGAAFTQAELTALASNMVIDLGVSFALLFIPGIIGASLTAEEY